MAKAVRKIPAKFLERVNTLIEERMQYARRIEVLEAKAAAKLKELRAEVTKREDTLAKIINATDKGVPSHTAGNITCYAEVSPKYKVKDRDAFNQHLVAPVDVYLEDTDTAAALKEDLIQGLNMFTNDIHKKEITIYRESTGAEEDSDGRLQGGKLPTGIGCHFLESVKFRKKAGT